MNTAAKGRRNEHRSRALAESLGYSCIRAAASKGPFDLVCWNAEHMLAIQVKTNAPPSPLEREEMREIVMPKGSVKLIHVWHDRKPAPTVTVL